MFQQARIEILKNYLQEKHSADYKTICKDTNISLSTLRRDIELLVEEGFLEKYRGGVILSGPKTTSASDGAGFLSASCSNGPCEDLSSDPHLHLKEKIGKAAAEQVEEGDIIFIGAGNSCLMMSRFLTTENITVVTHSFNVAMELASRPGIHLIFLGGDVESEGSKHFTSGTFAKETLKTIYVKKSFVTVNGISREFGYTINNHYLTETYAMLLKSTGTTCFLADETKFGKRAFRKICDFDAVDTLITTEGIPKEYLELYQKAGVHLTIA